MYVQLKQAVFAVSLFSLVAPTCLFAQNEIKNPIFYSIGFNVGENKPKREFLKDLTSTNQGVDFNVGWQMQGNKAWQVAYRYPRLGAGFTYSHFSNNIIGNPYGVYFFTNFPQITTKWVQVDFNVNLGLCNGMNPYDPIVNPKNIAISSSLNFQSGFYLEQAVHIGKHYDLFLCEGLTHISNGALGYPNMGLNCKTLKAGIRYKPKEAVRLNSGKQIPFDRQWQLITYLGAGMKTFDNPTPLYREILFSPAIYYRTGFKRRIGVGFEVAYNEAIRAYKPNVQLDEPANLMTYATHVSHEFLIDRFTVLVQGGLYLKNQPFRWIIYERIGIGYHLTSQIRWVVNLKAHFYIAEYIETGLVFDLNLN